jgi:tetratricopeptide (TPR) repeat protein
MALGFGFNKAKVLASAEKAVQQGKLQNAIVEYQKVLKEDPKDLTVLNTIGDLQARVGNNSEAAKCFQRVGEQYATDGFTVKAIAMYKKLTKLESNAETLQRLAELYTVQGLYNDARAQYVHVADAHLKNNNNDDAAKIFQKILELDPDNTAMQQKLADLYIKLGKKNEAVSIYLTAAQNLYIKQAMDAAEQACSKVLYIEKDNVEAKILKGTIAAESGDGHTAYECLKGIANLDSRPDALRSMLRAQIALKHLDEAGPIVSKLVIVHNDLSGVSWYADALLAENRFADGVGVYEQYADKVLAAQGANMVKNLSALLTKVKDSSKALLSLKNLFQKAGDTSHDGEITELLAHAYVEEGELSKAKDLYKQLAENEPENPLHAQNFKQVLAKLGEDTSSQITAEQGAQALMVEELEHKAPAVKQEYPEETAAAVQHALTDAELYDSYNLPAKVIAPLETGLQHAPRDVRINQKLGAAYVKAQRYVDAARCFNTLQEVFAQAGHKEESEKYAEMAGTYLSMPSSIAVEPGAAEPVTTAPGADDSSINLIQFSDMQEAPAAAVAAEIAIETAAAVAEPPAVAEIAMEVPVAVEASPAADAHEIAVDDWESMLSVEAPPAAPAQQEPVGFEIPVPEPAAAEAAPAEVASFEVSAPAGDGAAVAEFSFESATAEAPPAEISIPVEEPVVEAPPPSSPPKPVAAPPPAPSVAKPAPPPPAPPKAQPAAAASAEDDILGDLVSDLEESLGDSFLADKAPAKPAAAAPPKIAPPPAPASMPAAAASAAAPAPAKAAPAPAAAAQDDAASALSDIFSEFKEDAEATAEEAEDPDTHYNLGIAFKEMGLLDEAIGELQKVAKAIDQGHPFSQQMQAFTWLAQCLVDKGVPLAAVRWYERALKVAEIDEESKLAVYYDLGNAYEMAGNRQKAHDTFLEVYSSNIDYRDVADRIKALKN